MNLVKTDFDVVTLEDELRVDGLCRELLLAFYQDRLDAGLGEQEATWLANSADYFIRDFLIGARLLNILDETPGIVRKFAGNWYIVNTLEPVADEIITYLKGVREFYHFLHRHDAISDFYLSQIDRECSDIDYYSARIDSFWGIQGDGYYEWEKECSLKS